jgi:hypothetical protein
MSLLPTGVLGQSSINAQNIRGIAKKVPITIQIPVEVLCIKASTMAPIANTPVTPINTPPVGINRSTKKTMIASTKRPKAIANNDTIFFLF